MIEIGDEVDPAISKGRGDLDILSQEEHGEQ